MDLLLDYFPDDLTLFEALGLIIFSYFTSAVTATVGIGGGVMMLMAMASIMPIISVIPVHGAVQMGSNGGRAWLMRNHLSWNIFIYFLIGSLIGAAIASQVVVALPKDILRLILGGFVIWIIWGKAQKKECKSKVIYSNWDWYNLRQHVCWSDRAADRRIHGTKTLRKNERRQYSCYLRNASTWP